MAVDPLELLFTLDQALARDRDDQEAIGETVDPVEVRGEVDLGHQRVGIEARVFGTVDQEAEERLEVERVIGSGRLEDRVRVVADTVARGVADGTVVGDPIEAYPALCEADRQFLAVLPCDAERRIPTGPRQLVGKHARQHVEDPVGDAGILLGTDRSVLEALVRVVEGFGRIDAQEAVPAYIPDHDHDRNRDDQNGLQPARQTCQHLDHGHLRQKVFRYSISASFCVSGSEVP